MGSTRWGGWDYWTDPSKRESVQATNARRAAEHTPRPVDTDLMLYEFAGWADEAHTRRYTALGIMLSREIDGMAYSMGTVLSWETVRQYCTDAVQLAISSLVPALDHYIAAQLTGAK